MKKFLMFMLIIILALVFSSNCGKDTKNENQKNNNKESKESKKDGAEKRDKQQGKKKEFDIDKLDIPERMKQAFKAGKIPRERLMQFIRSRGEKDAPLVAVEKVKKNSLNAYLVFNGTVEPEKKVKIFARLAAYVKKIEKEEGDYVKKGTILALLDDEEIKISYRQAEIQLKESAVNKKTEETNFNRTKELKKSELISDQDYQTAKQNLEKAGFDYKNKQENFKNLQLQMNYTKIRAPIDGYIIERLIEVGSRVNSNEQVFLLEDFFPLLIKVYVPSADVMNLQIGMQVELTTDILKGRIFPGKIKLINPRIDIESGTVKVTVEVFDKTQKLKPGMFVEAKILVRKKKDAIVIPVKGIAYIKGKSYVFTYNRGQVSKKEVELGITEGDKIEILSGLDEGEMIVTVGVVGLEDKMRVRVKR